MQSSPHSLKEQKGEEEGACCQSIHNGGRKTPSPDFSSARASFHFSKLIPQSELEQEEMQGGHGREEAGWYWALGQLNV